MKRITHLSFALLAITILLPAQEKVDLEAVYRIKQEAFQNSRVMDTLFQLTDVHGPRLAGSPRYRAGAEWVVKQLREWGITEVRLEPWGEFGRGWENKKFYAAMTEPAYMPLIGAPQAWTSSTDGLVTGEPVLATIREEADLAKWKGKLEGKIVLVDQPRDITLHDRPDNHRYTEQELADLMQAQILPFGRRMQTPGQPPQNFMQMMAFRRKLNEFLREEKVALLIQNGRADFGTFFTSNGGSRNPKEQPAPPTIVLTAEHYNRIWRLLDRKIPVRIEAEVRNEWYDTADNNFNIIAEIPGLGKHKDELVMLGAHFDTWHAGTGATDNSAGSAVMLEVMRILKKLDLRLDRTVRLALWDGEEQGLLGSRGYVTKHFADRATMKTLPEYEKFSAYFNVDNGGGRIRGIYLQGNEMCRPIFEAWFAPLRDLGVTTISIRNTGGTDHLSFDAVGLPGFQFIQDPLEYDTRTHHTNMDVYDRIPREDMMQMSAVVATLVVHTANRDEKLPRKPRPEPRPQQGPPSTF
ncbi:MAG: M20/M25/M40 family metallo-hydrolase [Bryobacteraceae bacterium]